MADYQWYPGHMTKAVRMMQENIGLVDLVIEIVDSRIPVSSRNPDIDRMRGSKSGILIMNRQDQADPVMTDRFRSFYENKGLLVVSMDARSRRSVSQVRGVIDQASRAKREKDLKRGIRNRPVRAMVCGIPNVGKSTFINSLVGRASAKTGNKPGVTKGKQWISLGASIQLLDTPGILWPKFEDRMTGVRLALCGSIREEILDEEELAMELLRAILDDYQDLFLDRYQSTEAPFTADELAGRDEVSLAHLLERIASARNFIAKGQVPDRKRAAHMLIDDFQSGRIGRITLDRME